MHSLTTPTFPGEAALLQAAHVASTPAELEAALAGLMAIPIPVRNVETWSALGGLLQRCYRPGESLAAYRAATLCEPDNIAAICNLTVNARTFDREREAFEILRTVLRHEPTLGEPWHNLGVVARNLGFIELSVAAYRHAATLQANPNTHIGLADTLLFVGDFTGGREAAQTAVRIAARGSVEETEAHMARGCHELLIGDLGSGWDDLEYRLNRTPMRAMVPPDLPRWEPGNPAHRNVFVWREQGLGDELRYLSALGDVLANVDAGTVRCDPRLARIVMRSFPVETVTGNLEVPPNVDAQISVASLPSLLRRTLDAFPTSARYLEPDPERVTAFREQLQALGPQPKLGVSWRSKLMTNQRMANYPEFSHLEHLAALEGISLIDLQYDHHPEELEALEREFGVRVHHFADLDLYDDLDGVLALCAALDGVLTVGNAVAELAGAVGTRTFQLGAGNPPLEFGRTASVWHRNTTHVLKAWDQSWDITMRAAVAAIVAELNH